MLKPIVIEANMALSFVAEYLKIPFEMATDLRKRQGKSGNQAQEKILQNPRLKEPQTFQYYESGTGQTPLFPTLSEYMERRFIPTLRWYEIESRLNSLKFNIWKVVVLTSAFFLALLNALEMGLADQTYSNSLVPLASSICAIIILSSFAYLQASKIHENRIRYTRVKQKLEHEYQIFMLRSKHYVRKDGVNDSYATQLFVENVEGFIADDK